MHWDLSGSFQNRSHVESVCHDYPFKSEITTQQVGRYCSRQTGGCIRINGRDQEVPCHHRADTCSDSGFEWKEFARSKELDGRGQSGESCVAVNMCVAVTGEVLGSGDDTGRLKS